MTATAVNSTAVNATSTTGNPDVQILIDGKAIPWQEVFGQLQLFGKLRPFIQDIASQRILMQEVAARTDLEVDPVELDQRILEFREKKSLSEEEALRVWLQQEQIDYQGFRSRLYFGLKVSKLKQLIAEPDVQREFETRSDSFERLELSYLVSPSFETAQNLGQQLHSGTTSFEALAGQVTLNGEYKVKAPAAPVRRSWLPKELQEVLQSASPLELHGPLAIGEQWMVFRLERMIPANLDERLKRQLTDELFNRWLRGKLSGLHIRLSENSESD